VLRGHFWQYGPHGLMSSGRAAAFAGPFRCHRRSRYAHDTPAGAIP